MTAYDYWNNVFGEIPQNDAEKLAVAMMSDYGRVVWNEAIDEAIDELDGYENTEYYQLKIKELKK